MLTFAQIQKMVDSSANFLICKFHKTWKKFGEAGKYVHGWLWTRIVRIANPNDFVLDPAYSLRLLAFVLLCVLFCVFV